MAVPVRPTDLAISQWGQNQPFDLVTCFKQFRNNCIEAETPGYWTASYVYVFTVFLAFFFNILAIGLFIRGFEKFRKLLFYWLTFQLLVANLLYCIGLLISRDTLVIFAGQSQFDPVFLTSKFELLRSVSKCLSNFYSQILPYGIIALALHRFGIFILSGTRISEGYFMFTVIALLWLLVIAMTILLTIFDCVYRFENVETNVLTADGFTSLGVFHFTCGSSDSQTTSDLWIKRIFEAEQLVIPCLDVLIYIIIVLHLAATRGCSLSQKASYFLLIPPFSLFILVEASSLIGIFLVTTTMDIRIALTIGRITSIVDMTAASLIPIIIFATNKQVRQMLFCCKMRKKTVTAKNIKNVVPSSSPRGGGQPVRSETSHVSQQQQLHHQ